MRRTTILTALAALSLAACGGGRQAAAPTSESQQANMPRAAVSSEPTAAPAANSEPTAAPASSADDTAAIGSLNAGLDKLKSYRATFSYKVDGKDEQGAPQQGEVSFDQTVITGSKDSLMKMHMVGAAASGKETTMVIARVGDATYMQGMGTSTDCIAMSGNDSGKADAIIQPDSLVGGLRGAKLVGSDTVNGIAAKHYRFDEQSADFGAFASAKGEFWVASDGGFVVKYIGTASAKRGIAAALGAGKVAEGAITWTYELTEVNQVETIALPAGCAGKLAGADYPLPDKITDKVSMNGMLIFKSAQSPADVAAFYKKELAAAGWQAGEATETGDTFMLPFSKGDKTINVMINKEAGGASVAITLKQ